mgnify:CR=1 FL=1
MLFANHKINRLLTFGATGTLSKKNWNCAPSPPRAPFPQIPALVVSLVSPRAPFPQIPALVVPLVSPRASFPWISSLFVHERM